MLSHAMLRNSEWDEAEVHYPHATSKKVTYVFRRGAPKHEWEPWVVVGESAILKSLGRTGMGLYAGRPFAREYEKEKKFGWTNEDKKCYTKVSWSG